MSFAQSTSMASGGKTSPKPEIRSRYESLAPVMDERVTRLWAACEAKALGRGGIAAVTEATGILGKHIWSGMHDLKEIGRRPPKEPLYDIRRHSEPEVAVQITTQGSAS